MSKIPLRKATIEDIEAMHIVRMSVKENVLNNPLLVTEEDYRNFLTVNGRGWICTAAGNTVLGFAILDTKSKSVWALFVHPSEEKKGIGKQLHDTMLSWYFQLHSEPLWLCTAPGTRAEQFYRKAGWRETGQTNSGEIRFEMSAQQWNETNQWIKNDPMDSADT